MKKVIFPLGTLLFVAELSSVVHAQVYQCNGTWRSTPCSVASTPAIPASEPRYGNAEGNPVAKSKKESLIHETRKLTQALGSDYSTEKEKVNELADYCSQPEVSVEACSRANSKLRERLRLAERQESKSELLERRNAKLESREQKADNWKKHHPARAR